MPQAVHKSILIVEDDTYLRNLYEAELGDEGYRILGVSSATSAFEILKENSKIDLVILDLDNPSVSGDGVFERLLNDFSRLPVILSANQPVYNHDRRTWLADAFFVKSSNATELKRVIRRLLSSPD